MLIPNVLFRCNGSAVLLTNKASHVRRAKYSIPHIVRTNLAANDVAFNCVMQTEDAERKLGVRLNKDLIQVGMCVCCVCVWTRLLPNSAALQPSREKVCLWGRLTSVSV